MFPSTQKFHLEQCISANIRGFWRSACSITLFQQFVNIDRSLPGMTHWLHSTGLTSGLVWTQTNDSLRGLGPDCSVGSGGVSSHSCESSTDEWFGAMVCHVAGWSFSSLDICHAVHDEASRRSEGNKWRWWFPTVTETWPVCNFQHPKRQIACN